MAAIECPICLEPIDFGYQPLSALKCGHAFHSACILAWFDGPHRKASSMADSYIPSCPQCCVPTSKKEVVKLFAEVGTENQDDVASAGKSGLRSATRQALESQVANLSEVLEAQQSRIQALEGEKAKLKKSVEELEEKIAALKTAEEEKKVDETIDLVSPAASPSKNTAPLE
jgi:septal ring factor EnvC (AmiA/AmiB activator)